MTTDPRDGVWLVPGLDALLRGDRPPPSRTDHIIEPLSQVVKARCSAMPDPRRPYDYHDDRDLAAAWRIAYVIVHNVLSASNRRHNVATHTAVVSCRTLRQHVERLLKATENFDDPEFGSIYSLAEIHGEYQLLADALDEVLMEAGDRDARERVRDRCVQFYWEKPEASQYLPALVGLTLKQDTDAWRAGSGPLGVLAGALRHGQQVLDVYRLVQQGPVAASSKPSQSLAKARPWEAPAVPELDLSGPSLLVLASVEHLPGSAKDGDGKLGASTPTTARGEWAPFAARRWPLATVPDLAQARKILVAEFPYAEDLVDAILRDLTGRPHVFLRPLLLVGPPGCGKTRFARRLGEVLGLGVQVYPCAGVADAAALGTSRQWSTARACLPLQLLKRLSSASALFIWDELEKSGDGKQNGNLQDAILPLLNLQDASRFFDPMVEIPVDLSGVCHVATANSLEGLSDALRDRFRVFSFPQPRAVDLPALARGVLAELRVERGLDEAWCPPLDGEELALVQAHWQGGTVRLLRRLCETVLAGRETLATRN